MSINLSDEDHDALDVFIDEILEAYKDGGTTLIQARSDLAHVITAAAEDNPQEVVKYIRLKLSERGDYHRRTIKPS